MVTGDGSHKVIAEFLGLFDQLLQYFDGFNRLFTGKSVSFCHRIDDVGFGKGPG